MKSYLEKLVNKNKKDIKRCYKNDSWLRKFSKKISKLSRKDLIKLGYLLMVDYVSNSTEFKEGYCISSYATRRFILNCKIDCILYFLKEPLNDIIRFNELMLECFKD